MPASATGSSGISSLPDARTSSPTVQTQGEPEDALPAPITAGDAVGTSVTSAAPGPPSAAPEDTSPTVLQVGVGDAVATLAVKIPAWLASLEMLAETNATCTEDFAVSQILVLSCDVVQQQH